MNTEPGIGHNSDQFTKDKERVEELTATANLWLEKVPEIKSQEQAGKADDFRKQLRAMKKAVEDDRKLETDPLEQEKKKIKARYDALHPFLDVAFTKMGELITPWMEKLEAEKKEAERIAREKADQAAMKAEAAARKAEEANNVEASVDADLARQEAEAAAKDAEKISKVKPGIRGENSSRSTSFRTSWVAEVNDIRSAAAYYQEDPGLIEALEKLASADARGGKRKIPGFKVFEKRSLN